MKDIELIMENWRGFIKEAGLFDTKGNFRDRFYYINVSQVPDNTKIINNIAANLKDQEGEIENPKEFLKDRLFCTCSLTEEKVIFKFYFVAEGVSRDNVKQASREGKPVKNMEKAIEIYDYKEPLSGLKSDIRWAHAGPAQLEAEKKALKHIQDQFEKAGIFPTKKDKKGQTVTIGQTATITIKSSQSDKTVELKGVAGIKKTNSKNCVGDFEFFDINNKTINHTVGEENKPFLISHKAKSFLRYAGIKSTLGKLELDKAHPEGFTSTPRLFIKKVRDAFVNQLVQQQPERTEEGFWSFAEDGTVIYLIYGATTKKASCVIIGDMTLTENENEENENKEKKFTLGAEERIFIYPEIPEEDIYKPIYRSYYGRGGSTIGVEDADKIKEANNLIQNNEGWLKNIEKLNWQYEFVKPPAGVEVGNKPIIEKLSLSARFFISPYMNRGNGSEQFDLKQND